MKAFSTALLSVLALPLISFAADKEVIQLQRDVMLLQDQVRSMQNQLNEQITTLRSLLEQTLDRVNQVNTSVTQVDSVVSQRMESQQRDLTQPLANMGIKVDQMSNEFGYLRESVQDVSLRIGKLEQQMVDIKSAIATVNAPPPPPAESSSSSGTPAEAFGPRTATAARPSPSGPAPSRAPAGVSAQTLYDNAMRDKTAGRFDLAAQQFRDYLRWFSDTELAANAQFYLGEIEFNRGNFRDALPHFDSVLERYPENNKTEDSFYMKGMTLVKMGERTRGAEEFYELLRRYPTGRLAPKAKVQLRNLGLTTVPPKRASGV